MSRKEVLRKSAEVLAKDAVRIASIRARAMLRTAKGVAGFYPVANDDGSYGIGIKQKYYYMHFQNTGIRPFTMWSLEGKTVPMRLPGGRVIFRKATGVGRRKVLERNEKGQILKTGIRWRHPGLPPKNFIEYGMEQAFAQNQKRWESEIMSGFIAEALLEILPGKDIREGM